MTGHLHGAVPMYGVEELPAYMQDRIVTDDNGCWLWQVSIDRNGYGRATLARPGTTTRRWWAHRLAYELLVESIPHGLHIDHLCEVRNCCNPAHLEAVTPLENTRRSHAADYWRSKTHCPRQHPYDEANTRLDKQGRRYCRTCAREHMRRQRAAKKPRPTFALLENAATESPAERRRAS